MLRLLWIPALGTLAALAAILEARDPHPLPPESCESATEAALRIGLGEDDSFRLAGHAESHTGAAVPPYATGRSILRLFPLTPSLDPALPEWAASAPRGRGHNIVETDAGTQ